MKALLMLPLIGLTIHSCDAVPQRQVHRDARGAQQTPATKRLPQDSPANTTMPVLRADTAKQADMPVVKPPKNIQPK